MLEEQREQITKKSERQRSKNLSAAAVAIGAYCGVRVTNRAQREREREIV
jgi:hypothetical protein